VNHKKVLLHKPKLLNVRQLDQTTTRPSQVDQNQLDQTKTRPNTNSTKQQVDKTTSGPNDNSTKFQLNQTTTQLNNNSTKQQLDPTTTRPKTNSTRSNSTKLNQTQPKNNLLHFRYMFGKMSLSTPCDLAPSRTHTKFDTAFFQHSEFGGSEAGGNFRPR
jgi:hypothetical protein